MPRHTMKLVLAIVLIAGILFVIPAVVQAQPTTGQQGSQSGNTYIGQPVVDNSNMPKAETDFTVRQGYTADRIVSGIKNPAAHTVGPDGTLYVAEQRRTGAGGRKLLIDVVSIDGQGTAKTIRAGIPGPVNSMAYSNGYIYMAGGYEPGDVRRVSIKSGKIAKVFEGLGQGKAAPRTLLDVVQDPMTRRTDLYVLDSAGAVWRIRRPTADAASGATTTGAQQSVAQPSPTPGGFFGRQGVRLILGIAVLLVLAILVVNWTNRRSKV